jgi:hypothetical protein
MISDNANHTHLSYHYAAHIRICVQDMESTIHSLRQVGSSIHRHVKTLLDRSFVVPQ